VVQPERGAVPPHVQLPGESLDGVDRGVPAPRVVVVPGRDVHPQRPVGRVAERVVLERLPVDRVLLDASGELDAPGFHGDPAPSSLSGRAGPAAGAGILPADGVPGGLRYRGGMTYVAPWAAPVIAAWTPAAITIGVLAL